VKEPNISMYFFFRPSLSGVLFPMFCLLVKILLVILSECLRILIDCSQLSKTYTCCSVLSPEIVMHDAYIGGLSENNIK